MGLNIDDTGRAFPLSVERPPSLAEVATERLKDAILSGQLPPGARLVESELTAKLGISRTPLREALRALSAIGLVTISPTRRAYVAMPSERKLSDASTLQVVLEGTALRLLAARRDVRVMRELEDLIDKIGTAEAAADQRRSIDLAWQFHETVCARCGNAFVLPAWNTFAARLRFNDMLCGKPAPQAGFLRGVLAHLQAGNGVAAARALRRHVLAPSRNH